MQRSVIGQGGASMSKPDGTQSTAKQRRNRQTSKQSSTQIAVLQHPMNDDKEAWRAYWNAQGQIWRTEPEIDIERQEYLAGRYSIPSNIEQKTYPFKDIKLNRADVEYLLQYYHDKHGPLVFEIGEPAKGLDLRGAD